MPKFSRRAFFRQIRPRRRCRRRRAPARPGRESSEDEAYLTVTLKDGRKLEKHVLHAIGSLDKPMTNADLEDKFHRLAEAVLPKAQTDRLLQLGWDLETLPDAGELARAAAAKPAAA